MPPLRRIAGHAKKALRSAAEWIFCAPIAWRIAKADRELATAIFKRDLDATDAALAAGADPFAANPTHEGSPSLFVSAALAWASWDVEGYTRAHRSLFIAAQASPLFEKRAPHLVWAMMSAGPLGWMSAAALLRDGCGLAAPSQGHLLRKLAEIGVVGGAHARSGRAHRPDLDLLRAALASSESASPDHQSLRQLIGRRVHGPREINEVYVLAVETVANPAFADLLAAERLSVEHMRLVVSVLECAEQQLPATGAAAPTAPRAQRSRELMPLCWARIEHAELSQAIAADQRSAPADPKAAAGTPAALASLRSSPTREFVDSRDESSGDGSEGPATHATGAASPVKSGARRL